MSLLSPAPGEEGGEEEEDAVERIVEQRRVLALLSDPQAANSPSEAWAQVCQTLLAANEFMYLR